MIEIVIGLAALIVGGIGGFAVRRRTDRENIEAVSEQAANIIREAEGQQKEILLQAKEEAIQIRAQAESELKGEREEIKRQERRIAQKEENLDRKTDAIERRSVAIGEREAELDQRTAQIEELRHRKIEEIERVAGLTSVEARQQLLAEIEQEIKEDANRRVRASEAAVRDDAERRARELLATVIQRVTSEVVAETTVSVVPIPSDDMKGRIIGREGRNIRAIEAATGVDLIIDDTPDAVTLSGFDGVRREVARVALSKLVADGRIHPTRIEEVVTKAKQEVESGIAEAGEQAALDAEVPGLHPEVLKYFGRLKYRTSYGQNQLKHAIESAHLAAMIAGELGADVNVARRGALLHDLGKSIDHEVEGTHAKLGAEIVRRFGMSEAVAHCVEAHHEEIEPSTIEAHIVMIADAISGSRPGARRESLERYIQRLEALEGVANGFPGVEKSFAIQAGREVRIIVKPEEIDDLGSMRLARDISKKIEETLEYPGQIKVTVVRETRASEFAK